MIKFTKSFVGNPVVVVYVLCSYLLILAYKEYSFLWKRKSLSEGVDKVLPIFSLKYWL